MKAYLLAHNYELLNEGDEIKIIGIYSTREKALAAMERVSRAPGFCDHPDGFFVDEYELDEDHWVEGFGIVE